MLQCAGTPKTGYASCNALRVTSGTTAFQEEQAAKKAIAPQTVRPNAAADSPTGYGLSDLQSAYGLTPASSASGSGRTFAIVDAYDDPNAGSDLANTHDGRALMPLSGASRRSAPPRAAPAPAGQAPRVKGCDYFHLR
ncbi:hypothetical protein [Streptomyces sp. IMTB 2501]|uniref:hypothetical protein n=1 Tax=Streptomyces sp. IMTB 2501 TaxID=1776340 RepID=UPI002116D194|nr:hypothetical protein [Streptomyces sp. IMTB 2501]